MASRQLLELREDYRARLHAARAPALPLRLVDSLFLLPALTITRAAKLHGVTYVAGKRNVGKLVHAGILEEASHRRRNRIFVAPELLRILEAPDARTAERPEAAFVLNASAAPPRSSR